MGTTLHDLSYGLGVAVHPVNLLAGALGVIVGTTIGVIPALGPTQGAALLLPIVFRLPPATGLIFLSGLYMGAIYGGSVTSILFNIPGTPMSVASAFDGYPMALKGHGSRALAGSSSCLDRIDGIELNGASITNSSSDVTVSALRIQLR